RTGDRRIDDGCFLLLQWRRNDLGPAIAAAFPKRAQVERSQLTAAAAPEKFECLVERRDVLAPMNEKSARGVVEVRTPPDGDELQRGDEVHHPSGIHVQS